MADVYYKTPCCFDVGDVLKLTLQYDLTSINPVTKTKILYFKIVSSTDKIMVSDFVNDFVELFC